MEINYKDNGDFKKIYPTTLSENVIMNSGKNVEKWKKEVDDDLNKIEDNINLLKAEPTTGKIWEGNTTLSAGERVTPSKPILDCKNGWLLIFKYVGAHSNFNYEYIPKIHIPITNSGGIKLVLGSANGTYVQKYIYIKNETISGHDTNINNGNEKIELFNVYEYWN